MWFVGFGKVLALLPLLLALLVAVRHFGKAFKSSPMSPVDKAEARAAGRALVYLFVALALAIWLVPRTLGGVGAFWGLLLSAILAMTTILSLAELPSRLSRVDALLWRHGPQTPGYSRTKGPVPYVRWARRFAMLVFVLFVLVVALWGGADTNPTLAQEVPPPPAATNTKSTAPTTAATREGSSTAAPAAPEVFKNECGGPDPQKAPVELTIKFDVNGNNPFICDDGSWKMWSQANPNKKAPATALLTYWTVDAERKNGYGVVVIDGTSHLFWTTTMTWPSP